MINFGVCKIKAMKKAKRLHSIAQKQRYPIDIAGKTIVQQQVSGKQTHINTSAFPSGIYYVKLCNTSNVAVQKFNIIKQ